MDKEVVITEPVTWTHVLSGSPVRSTVTWTSTNAAALTVKFLEAHHHEWLFARDLMLDAVDGTMSGMGDVKAYRYDGYLYLYLDSPNGAITLFTSAVMFAAFLRRTCDVVARDAEEYDVPEFFS